MENGLTPKNWTLNDGDLEDLVSRLRERSPVDPATDDARLVFTASGERATKVIFIGRLT
jgi:hypothetical protein